MKLLFKNPAAILRYKDSLLLGLMATGAGCGMVYEYLIAHYAGRILGSVDTAVYAMIGLMIMAMGIGAFYARTFRCAYTGFAWLEAAIALVGGAAVLAMAGLFSLAYVLPAQLQHTFGLHQTISLSGGPVFALKQIAEGFPYLLGLLLGILIGMEIPFIARIREDLYKHKLEHNAGTVYGADYIGGGLGAAIWIWILLTKPIIIAAALTALLNLILGAIFLSHFYKNIKGARFLVAAKGLTAIVLLAILMNGTGWMNAMSNMLYSDQVVYSNNTKYQNLVITERIASPHKPTIIDLYINGQLQFSSADEAIYHSFLVAPVMLASARQNNILIIGGGDGLAAKEVLKWNPKTITLIDLDATMISTFKGEQGDVPPWLSQRLTMLNANALNDPRLQFIYGDAFKEIEALVVSEAIYDTIIVDLPDPSHPDLNKLYSAYFYSKIASLLAGDGAMVVQSTSPYHSKKAFLSIGKTLAATGLTVDQYHANVPSFGEWGWSLGTKRGIGAQQRITNHADSGFDHDFITYPQILAAFHFSKSFFDEINSIDINRLSAPTLYNYHAEGWRKHDGIYFAK
ncbi:polyamine aminopropyltransferase [Marinagarivorans algicola]|uniref:polyamine aminopropyltransferase n=1 Tax=Marinagarivorans algicola TaxID=1513270 RepID=UPI0037363ABC